MEDLIQITAIIPSGWGNPNSKVKSKNLKGLIVNNFERGKLMVNILDPIDKEVIAKLKVATWRLDAIEVDNNLIVTNAILSHNQHWLLLEDDIRVEAV